MTEVTLTQSPLTDDEFLILRRYYADWGLSGIVFSGVLNVFFIGFLFYVPAYLLWGWINPYDLNRRSILLLASAVVGVAFTLRWARDAVRHHFERKNLPNPMLLDVAGGVAHVMAADVTRAVEIEQYEDEGTGFFLELSDGRVLCVIGQDLDDYGHDVEFDEDEVDVRDQFPQTRIEYRYAPKSGYRLVIKGIGEPLRPFGRVKTARKFFKKDGYTGPEDGAFYNGPIEATLEKFGYTLL